MSQPDLTEGANSIQDQQNQLSSQIRNVFRSPKYLAIFYLAFLTLAEGMTTLSVPQIGMILHGVLLVVLLVNAALLPKGRMQQFLVALSLAPLIRLMSLSLPLVDFPYIFWYVLVGAPLIVATFFSARSVGITNQSLGLSWGKLPAQLAIALIGIGLGFLEFIILRPEPLTREFTLKEIWVPALILLIFTGFLEEIIFRGAMQHTSLRSLGWLGMFYVAAVFAVLHIGYKSIMDVFFVFSVAVLFGIIVYRTKSIFGVTLAHGLTNITLFLVFPFLIGNMSLSAAFSRLSSPQSQSALVNQFFSSSSNSGVIIAPTNTPALETPTPIQLIVSPSPSVKAILVETALTDDQIKSTASTSIFSITPVPAVTSQPTNSPVSPKPSRPVILNVDTKKMAIILAGYFQMGCNPTNDLVTCYPDETPLHKVFLDTYAIDLKEVTNSEYAACVESGACTPPKSNISVFNRRYYDAPGFADYPVIYVTWDQADTYCKWQGKRLPTEAEWEKAARGQWDTRPFPWGFEQPDCLLASFTSEKGRCSNEFRQSGFLTKGASPYRVLDMSGNVAEWVADWYNDQYYSLSPVENPSGPASGNQKVVRGGSLYSQWTGIRVPFRDHLHPASIVPYVGFRCAQ